MFEKKRGTIQKKEAFSFLFLIHLRHLFVAPA
jgi:hypothetical protein